MPTDRAGELYDWTSDPVFAQSVAPTSLPAPYTPPSLPAMVPPTARVVSVPGQVPYYAYQPAPVPYDPRPQLMYGLGVVMAGGGVLAVGVGVGSWFFFKGMALAVDSIIGLAIVAGAFVFLKASGGVRITNFHQGDNSTFHGSR